MNRSRAIRLAAAFALVIASACDTTDPVETEFDEATAITFTTSDGMQTELFATDGSSLATMELGTGGAFWQPAGGARENLEVVAPSAAPLASGAPRADVEAGELVVSSLPEMPADANRFLHDLVSSREVSALDAPVGDEVAYNWCELYVWDNMTCMLCVFGDCLECSTYFCISDTGYAYYVDNCPPYDPNGQCV